MSTVDQTGVETPVKMPRRISLVPVVGLCIGYFLIAQAGRLRDTGALTGESYDALLVWIAALVVWGLSMSWLSLSGRGRSPGFLNLLPGLWLPPFTVFATVAAIVLSPALRSAFAGLASAIPDDQMILLQVIRIAAIGSLVKTSLGRLPPAFGYGTGVPDFIFGVSAAVMFLTGAYMELPPSVLIAWNIAGALIFIAASLILQLCLPGPLQVFRREPDGRELLDFPLFLIPVLFGPVLLMGNCLHAAKLLLQGL